MNTIKRILAFLLLAVMMFSMVACDSGSKGSVAFSPEDLKGGVTLPPQTDVHGNKIVGNFAVPPVGYDGSEVTITFAHTMGANLRGVLDDYIADFNKLYPNITIEHSSYGGWSDIAGLINTEIIGGTQPNIAYCYPDHVALYNKSWTTVTLDDLIASEIVVNRADGSTEILGLTQEQIDDLKAGGFYEEGMVYGDGLMYTMPLSKSTEVLYYNKTFFEENGLSVPTNWEEMEDVCKKLKELDPTCIPLGYDSEDNMFITMCEQYQYPYTSATGDEHYLFNNDQCKSFAKEFREWYQAGYITTESLYGSYTSSLFTEQDHSVSHSYMCIGSSGGASYQMPENRAFEVGVAPIPQANAADPKVISQGPSLCLLKGTSTTDQQVVASWLFMEYLTTDLVFQTDFSSSSGYMPVLGSATKDANYNAWLELADGYENLRALVVKVGLEQTDAYFTSPAFIGSSEARTQVGALLSECMAGKGENVDELINNAFNNAYNKCKQKAG